MTIPDSWSIVSSWPSARPAPTRASIAPLQDLFTSCGEFGAVSDSDRSGWRLPLNVSYTQEQEARRVAALKTQIKELGIVLDSGFVTPADRPSYWATKAFDGSIYTARSATAAENKASKVKDRCLYNVRVLTESSARGEVLAGRAPEF